MIRSKQASRSRAALIFPVAVAMALAGCNSPMPPDTHGAQAAIKELALPATKPLPPNPEYARFPRYIGTLGGRQVEMKLGAKSAEEDPVGVHGEYQFVGDPAVYLVAGERMNPDDSNPQEFALHPAVPGKTLPPMSGSRPASAAPSLEPAPPKNAVGGTSNVIIGE